MQITRLNIERVRNLKAVALGELQPFNIFYGANGSGKLQFWKPFIYWRQADHSVPIYQNITFSTMQTMRLFLPNPPVNGLVCKSWLLVSS